MTLPEIEKLIEDYADLVRDLNTAAILAPGNWQTMQRLTDGQIEARRQLVSALKDVLADAAKWKLIERMPELVFTEHKTFGTMWEYSLSCSRCANDPTKVFWMITATQASGDYQDCIAMPKDTPDLALTEALKEKCTG